MKKRWLIITCSLGLGLLILGVLAAPSVRYWLLLPTERELREDEILVEQIGIKLKGRNWSHPRPSRSKHYIDLWGVIDEGEQDQIVEAIREVKAGHSIKSQIEVSFYEKLIRSHSPRDEKGISGGSSHFMNLLRRLKL